MEEYNIWRVEDGGGGFGRKKNDTVRGKALYNDYKRHAEEAMAKLETDTSLTEKDKEFLEQVKNGFVYWNSEFQKI